MEYITKQAAQKCLDDLSSENLIGNENDTFISLAEAKDRIEELPAADVVPKSEVDKWKSASEQLHKEMSERMAEERKIERTFAVVQIIGEILSNHTPDVDGFFYIHKSEFAELKKKYTEG